MVRAHGLVCLSTHVRVRSVPAVQNGPFFCTTAVLTTHMQPLPYYCVNHTPTIPTARDAFIPWFGLRLPLLPPTWMRGCATTRRFARFAAYRRFLWLPHVGACLPTYLPPVPACCQTVVRLLRSARFLYLPVTAPYNVTAGAAENALDYRHASDCRPSTATMPTCGPAPILGGSTPATFTSASA